MLRKINRIWKKSLLDVYKRQDHTRESVPLLGYSKCWKQGVNIGTRDTYADIAATLAQIFEIEYHGDGTGFLEMLK